MIMNKNKSVFKTKITDLKFYNKLWIYPLYYLMEGLTFLINVFNRVVKGRCNKNE